LKCCELCPGSKNSAGVQIETWGDQESQRRAGGWDGLLMEDAVSSQAERHCRFESPDRGLHSQL